jgi:hypothetical protein
MLLSQLAASDLPSEEVMRRVDAASSFVIDAKRDAARYGLDQKMLNRLDGVNLWNAPAMQAGSEIASIWTTGQVSALRQPSTLVQSRRIPEVDDYARAEAGRGLAANPFKGKSFAEIDAMLAERGFRKVGPDAASGRGAYFHPESGRKYYLDGGGVYRQGVELPHVDVHRMREGANLEGSKRRYPLGESLTKPNP